MDASLPHDPEPVREPATLARTRELALSAAWHGGLMRDFASTAGEPCTVVYRGAWSHGYGPDFTGAIIQVGNAIRTGDVEIHRYASDWERHGHHLDPRYNAVILHVVSRLDTAGTRREDGASVPTVVLDVPDADLFAIDQELPAIWDTLGATTCAEHVAIREPQRLRAAILRLGDERFGERVTRFEGELAVEPLPVILLRGLCDAFGYAENRAPMAQLAERLELAGGPSRIAATAPAARFDRAAALLFGLGGFLPMAPADASLAGLASPRIASIEHAWASEATATGVGTMPATAWTRARTRPANHPAARLATLASLLAKTAADPATPLLEALRSGHDVPLLLRQLTGAHGAHRLGPGRAIAVTASVVLPVAMAWAHHAGDVALEDAVSHAWTSLPRSEWSRPARRALAQAVGEAPLGSLGERAIQGLLHLDRRLCAPRRCYECPVAAEVIRDRQRQRATSDESGVQSTLPT